MNFDKLKAPSLQDLFVRTLQNSILSGELEIGEKLPSERELAEQMQISRAVVSAGLNELQNHRFIEIVPGKGSYVCDFIRNGNIETLNALMEYGGDLFRQDSVRSILDVRKAAQLVVVERAIQYTPESDFDKLGDLLGAMADAGSAEQTAHYVYQFWHDLSYYSGDLIIPLTVESFKQPVITLWIRFIHRYGADALVDNCRTILNLLYQRNLEGAQTFTRECLDRAISGDQQIYDK